MFILDILIMEMKIYIPSKGRAGKVTTIDVLGGIDATIVCPLSEAEEYKKYYKSVLACPDEIKGITATRNWILNNTNERWNLQIDDDAEGVYYYEGCAMKRLKTKEEVAKLFLNMFVLAEDMGTNLWGLQLAGDKKFYREYSPFSLSSVIGANLFGIVNDGQRFDERLRVKEDYDFCLMSLYRHKKVLRNNKYFIRVAHLTNAGGCVGYRTRETEHEAYRVMLKKWGNNIIKLADTRTFLKVVPPIRGI